MLRERLSASHEGTFTRRSFLEIERQRQAMFEIPTPTFVREFYASLVDIVRQMQTIYDYAALPADLTRDLDAAGVATLNLQNAFQARGVIESIHAKDDTHWNEAGNAVAVEAIWAFLRTRMRVR
jgi:hypothetical protein